MDHGQGLNVLVTDEAHGHAGTEQLEGAVQVVSWLQVGVLDGTHCLRDSRVKNVRDVWDMGDV